jgi:hypothetical protein
MYIRFWWGNPDEKRWLVRSRRRWGDSAKKDHKQMEKENVECHLAEVRDQRVTNLRFP